MACKIETELGNFSQPYTRALEFDLNDVVQRLPPYPRKLEAPMNQAVWMVDYLSSWPGSL
ncbi:hypothetical protein T265_04090 [Opisthorchis viverrini]|uniref:Uncharacterized protein n=1 Tax=Opisthorchis viverrini TaxID=6198 RepID=A0A074ZTV9_OPIVI|nr:hypothetical protein T265_04090 [Opisthorchis viverrini]KER29242.1 hypothetical protein T265_04090 [Opisthorchis viverrini]